MLGQVSMAEPYCSSSFFLYVKQRLEYIPEMNSEVLDKMSAPHKEKEEVVIVNFKYSSHYNISIIFFIQRCAIE